MAPDGDPPPLSGGPGDPPAPPAKETPPAPPAQLVEVTYGGKTFKVSPEAATVINQAKADADAARAKAQPPAPPAPPAPKKSAIPQDLMYTDPEKYTEMVIAEAEQRATQKLTAAYNRDQFERTFWSEFNKGNPDLVDDRLIADALYAKHFPQWTREGLTGEQALAKLAEMTRTEVTRIATKGGARKTPKARSEGPSDSARGGAPGGGEGEGDKGDEGGAQPYSTKSILAARRAARESLGRGDTKH